MGRVKTVLSIITRFFQWSYIKFNDIRFQIMFSQLVNKSFSRNQRRYWSLNSRRLRRAPSTGYLYKLTHAQFISHMT